MAKRDSKRGSRARDPRYTVVIGRPPNTGRRVVVNGRVRIEWKEEGRRRSKTIGANSEATRAEADEELLRILNQLSQQTEARGTMDEQHVHDVGDDEATEAETAEPEADAQSETESDSYEGYDEIKAVVDSVLEAGRRGALAVIELGDAAHERLRHIFER